MLRLQAKIDQHLRHAEEQSHAQREFHYLCITVVSFQTLPGGVIQALRPADDGVGQLQNYRFRFRQHGIVAIANLFSVLLIQPCRTGRVKTYAASVTTIADARVAQARHFLKHGRNDAVLPELTV